MKEENGKMVADSDHSMKGFPERIYVSTDIYHGFGSYSIARSFAHEDLEDAVPVGKPIEVGIYQLVRTAKFQKLPVEIKHTVKEVKSE